MMTTRFTTLQTPCETGLTRDRVLKANCMQQPGPQFPVTEQPHAIKFVKLCLTPFSTSSTGSLCWMLRMCHTHMHGLFDAPD